MDPNIKYFEEYGKVETKQIDNVNLYKVNYDLNDLENSLKILGWSNVLNPQYLFNPYTYCIINEKIAIGLGHIITDVAINNEYFNCKNLYGFMEGDANYYEFTTNFRVRDWLIEAFITNKSIKIFNSQYEISYCKIDKDKYKIRLINSIKDVLKEKRNNFMHSNNIEMKSRNKYNLIQVMEDRNFELVKYSIYKFSKRKIYLLPVSIYVDGGECIVGRTDFQFTLSIAKSKLYKGCLEVYKMNNGFIKLPVKNFEGSRKIMIDYSILKEKT